MIILILGCEYEIQSIFPSAKSLTVSSTLPRSLNRWVMIMFHVSSCFFLMFHVSCFMFHVSCFMFQLFRSSHLSLNSLVTLQGLPPPPARPPPVERLMSPDLETLLPPPSQFHTLPRPQRSGPATPNTSTRYQQRTPEKPAGSSTMTSSSLHAQSWVYILPRNPYFA